MSLIKYLKGDLFSAPTQSVLAHACNCHGSWGAGVAAEFRKRFPESYKRYNKFCLDSTPDKIVGTCLLLGPETDVKAPKDSHGNVREFWIACLFTSKGYGSQTDGPDFVANMTKCSLSDLKRQLEAKKKPDITVCMPRINAGLFRVPWNFTEKAIQDANIHAVVYDL